MVIEKVFENKFSTKNAFRYPYSCRSSTLTQIGFLLAENNTLSHVDGNFRAAYLPKSSHENEHTNIVIETPDHGKILTKQIAGAVARRIISYVKEGDEVHIGSPLGFIKLGSRMDIYLPVDSEILVDLGEEVRANITFLARLSKVEKHE